MYNIQILYIHIYRERDRDREREREKERYRYIYIYIYRKSWKISLVKTENIPKRTFVGSIRTYK